MERRRRTGVNEGYLPEIWVYCEAEEGRLTRGSRELLGKARFLAEAASCAVTAILFEKRPDSGAAQSAISFGADLVYCFFSFRFMDEAGMARAIEEKMADKRPWAFLFPATAYGRTVAAMLSVRLETGLTADCTALSLEEGFLKQTRPAFGGSLMADVFCRRSYPQMATVRSGVFPLPPADDRSHGKIIPVGLQGSASPIVLEREKRKDTMRLYEAQVVLAGGMGLKTAEGFRLLEETAQAIGAAPAASRAAVNAGFAPYAWQVGQSGMAIRPRLYIACGISGAVQHMAGIQGAGKIIAVNHDRKAPIFQYADFGICGDCLAFLQKLSKTYQNF